MKQNIEIDGKQVPFRASAAIPRIYRMKFHRDIYKDLRVLEKSLGEGNPEESSLDMFSLEMFENIAYIMAKHADTAVRILQRNGWMVLIPSPFIRYSRSSSSCGVSTPKQRSSLKKLAQLTGK